MQKDKSSNKKKKCEKGDFGYLDYHKKNQLVISIFSMLMVVIICVTGILIYHSQKTIFAVMAALAALPAAKLLVGYIVLMPYHSIKNDIKEKIEKVRGDTQYDKVLYDVLLSSKDKAMYAGVVFIKNGKIYGYTNHYKKTGGNTAKNTTDKTMRLSDIEKHIRFIIDANCSYSAVKMYDSEDAFLKAVEAEKLSEKKMDAEDKKHMANMNGRIAKQLMIYMF